MFSPNSKTLISVFSTLLLREFQTITVAVLGMRAGSCGPSKLLPFNSKVEPGRRLESAHSYPVMRGSPCPGGAVLCRKQLRTTATPAPSLSSAAALALHLGLGCLKELTQKQASFSFFKGNVRNHSHSYRARHVLINVLPALPPHHTL